VTASKTHLTSAFNARTVELVRTSVKSLSEVCRDTDLTETAVRRWVAQADMIGVTRPVRHYCFNAAEKAEYSVAQLCPVLQVARNSCYAWQHRPPSPRAEANAVPIQQIREVHDRSCCTYRGPRVHAGLRARGSGSPASVSLD